MKGKGIWSWLKGRATRREVVSRLVEALNAREFDALEPLMADELLYLDSMSTPLNGRAAFVAASLRLVQAAPDMRIEVDEISGAGDTLLVQGRIVSEDPDYCSESLWRLKFRRGRICELQAFRDHNAISLPSIYRRTHAA